MHPSTSSWLVHGLAYGCVCMSKDNTWYDLHLVCISCNSYGSSQVWWQWEPQHPCSTRNCLMFYFQFLKLLLSRFSLKRKLPICIFTLLVVAFSFFSSSFDLHNPKIWWISPMYVLFSHYNKNCQTPQPIWLSWVSSSWATTSRIMPKPWRGYVDE